MSENKYNDAFFENFEKMYSKTSKISVEHKIKPAVKQKAEALKRSKKAKKNTCKTVKIVISVLLVVAVVAVAIGVAGKKKDVKETESNVTPVVAETNINKYPMPKTDETVSKLGSFVKSKYAVLVDVNNNKVIAGKNYNKKISPASLTKILTLLVAVENCNDLTETFTMTTEITDPLYIERASVAGFLNNEKITIKDLLYGAILPSGADATAALAIHIAGSEENFAKMMTEKAKEIGITTANFKNCSGLYDEEHYCTVLDMAHILKVAMENETCREVLSTVRHTTQKTKQHPDGITLQSTLFSRMTGEECIGAKIIAGKTGYVNESGNCIASYAVGNNGNSYIFVSTNAKGTWDAVFDHINVYSKYVGKSNKLYKAS